MAIYLLRRGPLLFEGTDLGDDRLASLSLRGRQLARAVGRRLREEGIGIEALVTSTQPASVQTAELAADALDHLGEIPALACLSPGAPARLAGEQILRRGASVLVVGDEPALSSLGAFLCGRPSFPPLREAQVSVIDSGRAAWLLDPDTLERKPLLLA